MWICINFIADPDPAFYLNAVPFQIRIQGAKPMRIHADPDPGQTLPSQKVYFPHEN
jgi:hypothetical protein